MVDNFLETSNCAPVMSFVASMMKMTEIKSEKISSVKRVKNSTMFDRENALRCDLCDKRKKGQRVKQAGSVSTGGGVGAGVCGRNYP